LGAVLGVDFFGVEFLGVGVGFLGVGVASDLGVVGVGFSSGQAALLDIPTYTWVCPTWA
jgi:hypothetical protein